MASGCRNSVRIRETCQISPFHRQSDTQFSLPLTFFDVFWLKFPPVERIYFYEITDLTPHLFYSAILPRLKHSLSLALCHFLPLAGHIKWPPHSSKPLLLYTPHCSWVSLVVAESDADFHHLSSHQVRDALDSHPYVPMLSVSDTDASIIAIQITFFPNKGFSIAYSIHHAVLDGTSITMFLRAWSFICKHFDGDENSPQFQLPSELVPSFDRAFFEDPSGLEALFINQWEALTGSASNLKLMSSLCTMPNIVRSTFQLSREDINKLKERMTSQVSNQIHLSSFVVTYAYVLVCMVKARGGDDNRKVHFLFVVDYRSRLDPPVPGNYFGNCVFPCEAVSRARDFMEDNGVAVIGEKISGVIKGLEKRLFEGAETMIPSMKISEQGIQFISVAGSPRFEVYEFDFGWGRPKKVEIISIDRTGAVSLNQSRDEKGGVEIGLALPRHEMDTFASLFVDGLKDFQ
ncbi:hypothetical protein K2173_010108 [Erythroxylum novogranatense]|uniref:Phenolic glucoside malonyltransferase 1-like n=1 Tax=Erythroxylum novogranatense TaxID=1862640 RepID=A0AAV8SCC2_9ROSI|nr:hypothetical protein K2173_010108 [Erythroxylum novogranatense]